MIPRWDDSMRAYIDDEKGRRGMEDRYAEGLRRAAEIARTASLENWWPAQKTREEIADAILASIPPNPPPMASEDEAIAEALEGLYVSGIGPHEKSREMAREAVSLMRKLFVRAALAKAKGAMIDSALSEPSS